MEMSRRSQKEGTDVISDGRICHYTNNGTTKQCDMQPYSGPPISAAEIFYAQSDSASRSKATSSAGGASPSATVAG